MNKENSQKLRNRARAPERNRQLKGRRDNSIPEFKNRKFKRGVGYGGEK